ncbi:MAG: alpha amylase C-terminal domain-containing protein, partial [Anaerolineales bacterium]|nr:alpha amylase C-terminal domain-containing protein [Anaerolineales bacterium]
WLEADDWEQSVVAFLRKGGDEDEPLLVVGNFTPVVRENHRLGVPRSGRWQEILNSDAEEYHGSGQGNLGGVEATPTPSHGYAYSVNLRLPPLAVLYLAPEPQDRS